MKKKPLNPLVHFVVTGAAENCNPHPDFDTKYYLDNNPDVSAAGINPLAHFLLHGQDEGRQSKPAGVGASEPGAIGTLNSHWRDGSFIPNGGSQDRNSPNDFFRLLEHLNEPAEDLISYGCRHISRFMYFIWWGRNDLKAAYPLEDREGRDSFAKWFLFHGLEEFHLDANACPDELVKHLSEPVVGYENSEAWFTKFVLGAWENEVELQAKFPVDTALQRRKFVLWLGAIGRDSNRFSAKLLGPQFAELWAMPTQYDGIGQGLWVLWQARPDLQARYNLLEPGGRRSYIQWFNSLGQDECDLRQCLESVPT
jgi:hypothetical protein